MPRFIKNLPQVRTIANSDRARGRVKARFLTAFCLALLASNPTLSADEALPQLEPSPQMATRLRWPQYAMVSGRLVATSSQPTNISVPLLPSRDGRRERLALNLSTTTTNLQYELSTATERLTIALADSTQLSVHRVRNDGEYELRFEQEIGKPLRLMLQENWNSSKRSWTADSFWHLAIAEPELVRRHLIPLLEILHPNWQLAALASGIEEMLFQRAQSQQHPDRQRWSRLVEDLARPEFAVRQNAERELYKAGQVVVPFLQNLDRTRLDAEQAYRVRSLVDALAVGYEDTADRVVVWLSGDEQVWAYLLTRGEIEKRRVAVEQLGIIWGAPPEFDPAADATVRKAQFERLQSKLRKPVGEKLGSKS